MNSSRIPNLMAFAGLLVFAVWMTMNTTHAQSGGAAVPSAADITTMRGAPARAAAEYSTASVTTSIAAIFSSDVTTKTAELAQNILVTNRHASNNLCVFWVARSTTETCNTAKCGSGPTCSGASTDASLVLPGNQRSFILSGEVCACWIASAASTLATAERIARTAN